ncbi:hypothetical protein HYX01_02175 [Candidatus Woesearchaeota archaeon]|nr:hypothetical protein [Candidatus Woesearchaeota archaeon]
MREIVDFKDKVQRYFKFTPLEVKNLIIAVSAIAFIISFREWGYGREFSFRIGLFNFFNAILIVALSFLFHISMQRIWSLATGYRLEWKMWGLGLLFGIIMAFLTNGVFWLILPGGFIVHHMAGHRLGWFRYDINYWALGVIAVTGTFATVTLAAIFKALSGFFTSSIIQKVIIFNLVYAFYSLIPISPLDGSRTFYGSRMLYAFSTSAILAAIVLLNPKLNISVGFSLLSSLLIAIISWVMYYIFFEHKAWAP